MSQIKIPFSCRCQTCGTIRDLPDQLASSGYLHELECEECSSMTIHERGLSLWEVVKDTEVKDQGFIARGTIGHPSTDPQIIQFGSFGFPLDYVERSERFQLRFLPVPDDPMKAMATAMGNFQRDHQPVQITIDPLMSYQLIGTIQLALRHPDNSGPSSNAMRQVKDQLIDSMEIPEEIRNVILMGDNPWLEQLWTSIYQSDQK